MTLNCDHGYLIGTYRCPTCYPKSPVSETIPIANPMITHELVEKPGCYPQGTTETPEHVSD